MCIYIYVIYCHILSYVVIYYPHLSTSIHISPHLSTNIHQPASPALPSSRARSASNSLSPVLEAVSVTLFGPSPGPDMPKAVERGLKRNGSGCYRTDIGESVSVSNEWRTKLLTTRNGHGQSGWSPIGCEGVRTNLHIPSPLSIT